MNRASNRQPVVFVLNQFSMPKSHAGGTRHVELFSGLQDWSTRIFTGSKTLSGEKLSSGGLFTVVPVTPYRGNGLDRLLNWGSYSAGALVRAAFARPRPAVVYGSSPHMGAALAAAIVATVRRVPFVLEIRDLWPQILAETGTLSETSIPFRILRRLERFLYRRADRIVVLAEGSIDVIGAEGIDREKIIFVPNFGDSADFSTTAERDAMRQRLQFTKPTVVYAGAHGPANGLDLVLDAAAELQAEDADVEFVLYGGGVSKPTLVERAKELGLRNVSFRDPVPKNEIPEILAAADIGLHSLADMDLFKSGVSPNKLYDYMAAGLPVITNNRGDMSALVERAGCGFAVEPTGIADGVRRMLAVSSEERKRMSEAGKAFMDSERSRTTMTRRVEALLDEVAGRSSSGR